MTRNRIVTVALLIGLLPPAMLLAQLEITSYTVDSGGGYSAGGSYEIDGTVGQHDAGPATGAMTGGSFSLEGGFWPETGSTNCPCPGDMNSDGNRNGADIQWFVSCMLGGTACGCADVDGVPGLSMGDVTQFISDVLAGAACP
ncbi:MAG: hypothetical protein H6818_03395 [Phycisphaerales bacterium]|nr:hypothetical protein [Phycisphaerales bacterium]MCB9864298.1 hypothetical protein [Phycisphaerales bacterium]